MPKFRRIVTGHRADGKSVIATDTTIDGVSVPGNPDAFLTRLWGADSVYTYPDAGGELPNRTWFPPIGGVRFIAVVFPPETDSPDTSMSPEQIAAALEERFPGLTETFEPDTPGMHRSATTDMLYVTSGRCILELDDGSETVCAAGDVIVQSGTMHRWKNPYDEPCHLIGVLVGAQLA